MSSCEAGVGDQVVQDASKSIKIIECVKHTLTCRVSPPEENAVVWYSLLPGTGYELFSINPYTGLITTTSYLDREQQQHFTLRGRTHEQTHAFVLLIKLQGKGAVVLHHTATAMYLCEFCFGVYISLK